MKKVTLLAAVAILFTACNNEDNYIDDPVAAQISATISESPAARASDSSWDEGDNIGITMNGRYLNFKYTTEDGDGKFVGRKMYFKNKQTPESLTAYYPYSGSEDETPAVIEATTGAERQTPGEQKQFDFLYAVKENVSGSEPNVNFLFSHMMSKLTFVLKNGNDGTDVSKITSCELNGLIMEGTFNPVTGACAATATTPAAPLNMTPTMENGNAVLSMILFPQTPAGEVTMKIADSEQQGYRCTLKFDGDRLQGGDHYVYTIIVKKTELVVEEYTIVPWTERKLGSDAVSE